MVEVSRAKDATGGLLATIANAQHPAIADLTAIFIELEGMSTEYDATPSERTGIHITQHLDVLDDNIADTSQAHKQEH
jgi:hypothetical protein